MTKIFGFSEQGSIRSAGKAAAKKQAAKSHATKNILRQMSKSFDFGHSSFFFNTFFYTSYKNINLGKIMLPFENKVFENNGFFKRGDVAILFDGYLVGVNEFDAAKYVFNAYKDEGIDFLKRLNGVFVIVIYDSGKLIIANDRLGMKPLYYYFNNSFNKHSNNNIIVFGSEIKAVIAHPLVPRVINWGFWKDFFSYGYSLGNKTPFVNVSSLEGGSILTYDGKSLLISKYWDFGSVKINRSRSVNDTIDEGVRILRNVFVRQTRGLDECIVMLSGGYDSRCIATSIKRFTDTKIKAYTIAKSYPVPKHPSGDKDAKYARQIAETIGVEYKILGNNDADIYKNYFLRHVFELDGLCNEHIWAYPLIDSINDVGKTNFDGIAGDVFLKAGYLLKPEFHKDFDLSNDSLVRTYSDERLSNILYRKMLDNSLVDVNVILGVFREDVAQSMMPDSNSIIEELRKLDVASNKVKIFQITNRTRNIISLTANNIFARKILSRFPFCDNEFVEFALSIPVDMKVNDNIYFRILKKAFPDVMNIPTTNDPKNFRDMVKFKIIHSKLNDLKYVFGKMAFRKQQIVKRHKFSLNPRDIDYLIGLAENGKLPVFIEKDKLLKILREYVSNDIDPTDFLEPIMQFCAWYDAFVKE